MPERPTMIDDPEFELALLKELNRRRGKPNAVSMGALYEAVTGLRWSNRINDTRKVRAMIDKLQQEGQPICSCGRGYFIGSGSEVLNYADQLKNQGIRKLAKAAKIRGVSLAHLIGQAELDLRPREDGANG